MRYHLKEHFKMNVTIREASEDDAESLLKIYAPYVEKTAISFEYSAPSLDEFRKRIANIRQKYPYVVAVLNGEIVGYAYAGTFHARDAYLHTAELSIYVDERFHRFGIGTALYDALEERLKARGFHALYACIAKTERENDEYLTDTSPRFHEKRGYHLCGTFKDCAIKFNQWYSIVYYEKHI